MMRIYCGTIEREYEGNGKVLYASKAFSCEAIYRIADSEKIGIDVVSGGELYTALKAGFPASEIYMHGNNKLGYELKEALDAGIGCIVADAYSEIDTIEREAEKRGRVRISSAHQSRCGSAYARLYSNRENGQ
ncbi:MAG: hypothetical protein ACLRSW_09985 [Christensenellaceae bacterium]